jgi:hypothetical protein
MTYQLFLFSKLYDIHKPSKEPYDVVYEDVLRLHDVWLFWDTFHGASMGEYESMETFLKSH